ncbi:M6 family metalloprotease domain-containing protein [Nocardioides euryhalodurans]|uniref:M6 family metalloprotease domain-containing protein n=1 Tax=Nocardioides euryhalodurans TaxID=2518370 RepID=UPI001FC98414|nr:M6 family metalloprotease domain-containing protein [Nocardioides euryhalodurans]
MAIALTASAALGAPAPDAAERPDEPGTQQPFNHWRYDHWPQVQPWQEQQSDAELSRVRARGGVGKPGFPAPVDPQEWENPDHMTWSDYTPIPGTDWADPEQSGSERTFRGALVVVDYPNKSFAVSEPANSTVFGNPSTEASSIPREDVPAFYRDFLNTPNQLNRGHTIHEYWMEDSGGRYGVELTEFGAYEMPGKSHEYAMEFQGEGSCPTGDSCDKDLRADAFAAWQAAEGTDVRDDFDFVYILSAGQDESSTWQEFGPMKWEEREQVTDPFGPPDESLPNWSETRYVDWTSWASGSTLWPNAGGGSTTQAESSGMGVYAHELSHVLGIGDNYNNPFGNPPRRTYTGVWEMLSRGSFNGPGGPHSRWTIPATGGGSMGAQHMLRNKMKLEMVSERHVLRLGRGALDDSGLVVARVTARAVVPQRRGLSGINLDLGGPGDLSGPCDPATDPMCDGGGYDNYTLEVVDRMGTDSFTPDSGTLIAKTKDLDRSPFAWVVDANPQDIGMTDFVRPDGTEVPITIGDYRQLSDALLHAGTESGSEFEYVDEANRLHFYVLEKDRDRRGQLSYLLGIRSLDGSGPQTRGVGLRSGSAVADRRGLATCRLPLTNTGRSRRIVGEHPEGVAPYVRNDIYRLSARVRGAGWSAHLPQQLATTAFGSTTRVTVYARNDFARAEPGRVRLTARSESDPDVVARATCRVRMR